MASLSSAPYFSFFLGILVFRGEILSIVWHIIKQDFNLMYWPDFKKEGPSEDVFLAALAALHLTLYVYNLQEPVYSLQEPFITFRNRFITFRNWFITFRNWFITFRNHCQFRLLDTKSDFSDLRPFRHLISVISRGKDRKTKRKKTEGLKYKKKIWYCDVRAVSHSCDVFIQSGQFFCSQFAKKQSKWVWLHDPTPYSGDQLELLVEWNV